MNIDFRARPKPPYQPSQDAGGHCNAAGGGRQSWPGDMDEDRTAASRDARADVMVDLDHQVIKCIRSSQSIAWFAGGEPDGSIVAAVRRVLAPRIPRSNRANRQLCTRSWQPIAAPPQPDGSEPACGRCAIPLPLVHGDAGAAKRDRDAPHSGGEPTLTMVGGPRTNVYSCERQVIHNR